jgi:hypothetical protein
MTIKQIRKTIILYLKGMNAIIDSIVSGKCARIKINRKERILLCGNGPSLNDIDFDKVVRDGLSVSCVNFFPISNQAFWDVKPKYLCLIDPVFYTPESKKNKKISQLFQVLEKVDWELKIICINKQFLPISNEHIHYSYICKKEIYGGNVTFFLDWLYRNSFANIGRQNVAIAALFYFINMNARIIYLIGIDMSEFKQIFVDNDNNIYIDTIHNYGEERVCTNLVHKGELYRLLNMYQRMFEQFYFLSEFAKRNSVKVINLSGCSYLDMFDRGYEYTKKRTT